MQCSTPSMYGSKPTSVVEIPHGRLTLFMEQLLDEQCRRLLLCWISWVVPVFGRFGNPIRSQLPLQSETLLDSHPEKLR